MTILIPKTILPDLTVLEYRVSDPGILKSIGVLVSDTGIEVSEDRVSDTENSIGCPSLHIYE
jgi:hypothetical protein